MGFGSFDRISLIKIINQGGRPMDFDQTRFDWLLEARRRAEELDDGSVQAVPGDEVMKKARVLIE